MLGNESREAMLIVPTKKIRIENLSKSELSLGSEKNLRYLCLKGVF